MSTTGKRIREVTSQQVNYPIIIIFVRNLEILSIPIISVQLKSFWDGFREFVKFVVNCFSD